MGNGILRIVPTPIGNLEDITERAKRVLSESDIIACEDTRTSSKLLNLLGITYKKLMSYHEHNELQKSQSLIQELLAGKNIALVSDAGTPCISDPGYRLIKSAHENGIKVESLPGASAFVVALAASGFPSDKFIFMGFPPHKKGRQTFFKELLSYTFTKIIYESPHRLMKCLTELSEYGNPDLNVCIARELTKMHEEILIGKVSEIKQQLEKRASIKGEFVIIIE